MDRHLASSALRDALEADVRAGLTATPKTLPPKWFYDARGSELFTAITGLPEYYPTRRERAILRAHASDIAALAAPETLIELGSGTSEKTRLLLDALQEAGTLRRYVPFDVDETVLATASAAVAGEYPTIAVHAVVGDFEHHLPLLLTGGRRLMAFLGGTIGNLTPPERAGFLATLAQNMAPRDSLLVGTDLVKDPARLVAAYDDAAGVTAEFNRNVLRVLVREPAPTSTPTRSSTSRCGTPRTSGWRCACDRSESKSCGSWTCRFPLRRERNCAPRSAPNSGPSGSPKSSPPAGSSRWPPGPIRTATTPSGWPPSPAPQPERPESPPTPSVRALRQRADDETAHADRRDDADRRAINDQ